MLTRGIAGRLCSRFVIAAVIFPLAGQALPGQDRRIPVRIGVVAAHSQSDLSRTYEPLTRYLSGRIPSHSFQVVRLADIDEAVRAVERREAEFINCSPSTFVELDLRIGARALVTQEITAQPGESTPWMAGAVFCLRERQDIRTLADMRGKRVIGLDPRALGGWLSVLRELRELGIEPERDFARVSFGGFYDRVVRAVLDGSADVGVLSASALRIASLDLSVSDRLRVLPPSRPIDPTYPLPASTRLYPESPIVSAPHVSARLADQMAVALLSLPRGSEMPRASLAEGYTLPLSYQSVHDCLKDLRFGPYADYGKIPLLGAIRQHWGMVFAVLIGLIALLSSCVAAVLVLNRRLRRSRQRLAQRAQLLAQVSDAIVGLDLESRVIAWNGAAEKLLGWTAAEAAGRPIHELVLGFPAGAVGAIHDRADRDGRWSAEVALTPRSGGTVIAEIAVSPLRDSHGAVIGTVSDVRDVTQVRKLEEQYRQAQKLESIGRLAGGVAHDFNNLLTVINGYSDVLLSRMEPGHPQRQAILEIGKAGQKAAGLVQQLLAFGRKQLLQLEVLDLNAIVAEDLVMLRRLIGENIELRTSFHDASPMVRADRVQLQQVLLNLAVNARDAMPSGGTLMVETREAACEDGCPVLCKEVAQGRCAVLTVSDTGVGIDAETRKNLFEPFFTTKAVGKGSGLGLSTVFGIVKQSGGHITVDSQPGAGATFRVYLPLMVATPSDLPDEPPVPASMQGSESLLVVEDQTEVRRLVSDVLASFGYRVLAASGPAEALQLLSERSFEFDLLLTDVVMPGMNGRELAERIRLDHPDVRVLFISGYGKEAAGKGGILAPGAHYLQKPFAPEALARKVRQILDGARR